MYRCVIEGAESANQYEELIKVFLRPGEYEIHHAASGSPAPRDKDEVKRGIYRDLAALTGKLPKWGILTGIRPVKLAGELFRRCGSAEETVRMLMDRYLVSREKAELVMEIYAYQRDVLGAPKQDSLSLYIGIPFCPTRCLYCSFTSNQVPEAEIARYLIALHKEIDFAGEAARRDSYRLESVYIGGGTPTTLTDKQLDSLLGHIGDSFDLSDIREFTVEAGRPDTITAGKLGVLREYGVGRISVNPQSMKQETLDRIGRAHTVEDVERAFALVNREWHGQVNADLIAGLPGEEPEDFEHSLERVMETGADNITLHTLAVKRASRLKEMDEEFNYKRENAVEKMLTSAEKKLRENGYRPYYLYRQKNTSGSTENMGYCRDDKVSAYNVRIMEEEQSILALGAGGISKIYFPSENRLERVANVSNYEQYIDRIDEMIERKKKGFFRKNIRR